MTLALALVLDILHLKSGGKYEGKVTDAGDSYRVDRGNGVVITVKKAEVDRLVPCRYFPDPPKGRAGFAWDRRHLDATNFYRLDPPKGWRPRAPRGKAAATFHAEEAAPFDVFVQRNKIDDVIATFRTALEKSGRVEAGERWLEATFRKDEVVHRSLWIFVAAPGDRVFTVAYAATDEEFKEHAASVRDAAATLKGFPEHPDAGEFARLIGGEEFARAVALVDDFEPAYLELAELHASRGQGKEAEAAFKRARELDPTDVRAAVAYARFLCGRTDFKAAEALLDPIVEAHPYAVDPLIQLARACVGQGKFLDALACTGAVVRLDRGNAEAHYLTGLCHEKQGNKSEALQAYRQAFVQDENHAAAREALTRLGWKEP